MPTTIILYRWRITCPTTGRPIVTRHKLSEADARAVYPEAEAVEWSREVRQVPDDPLYQGATSVWQRQEERPEP